MDVCKDLSGFKGILQGLGVQENLRGFFKGSVRFSDRYFYGFYGFRENFMDFSEYNDLIVL